MDKEEYKIKLEEINRLVESKDYEGAMKVVDSVEWRRVKDIRTLCVVGEIYAANKRYGDSKEIFLLAYHRAPIGKTILYRLMEVSLKMGDIEDAEEFYEEFLEVASNDNTRYILKYKLYHAKKAPLDQQIAILEEYKEHEFTERWSYELAKLYYKAGEKEKCIEICDDLVLWFSEGKYVTKALDLKMRMGVLSGAQLRQYEEALRPKLRTKEELQELEEKREANPGEEREEGDPLIDSIKIPKTEENSGSLLENTGVFQEKIAQGIKDIFSGRPKEREESEEQEEFEGVLKRPEEGEVEALPLEEEEDQGEVGPKELKLPEMIKAPEMIETPKAPVIPALVPSQEEIRTAMEQDETNAFAQEELSAEKELGITRNFDFNLEESILAAASAQGIQLPEEPKEEKDSDLKEEPSVSKEEPSVSKEEPSVLKEEPSVLKEEPSISKKEASMPEEPAPEEESSKEESLKEQETKEDLWDDQVGDTWEDVTREKKKTSSLGILGMEIPPLEPEQVKAEIPPLEAEQVKAEIPPLEAEQIKTEIPRLEPEVVSAKKERQDRFEELEGTLEEELLELLPNKNKENIPDMEEKILASFAQPEGESKQEPEKPHTEEELLEQFINQLHQEPEKDPLDLIPREMKLDDSEKQLFTYFSSIPGIPEQLVETLADVQQAAADKTSKTGNVIIMGIKETGKTRLSQSLILAICRELHMEATKIANITGAQMNEQDPAEVVSRLSGGFLVIEGAAQMSAETIDKLGQAMDFRTDGLTVIIEDEKIGMRKLIAKYPKFAARFTSMINIPVFTNDELVHFAKIYTQENGYTMDQMGVLALYNLIGDNQKDDEPMTIGKVKDMLDAAIARAESGARRFKRNLSKKRTDEEGRVILYEKDFN